MKGEILYGLHFYPGVAEYSEDGGSFRVYLSEDALRKMDPTFGGRPVFVEHTDEVEPNLDKLREEADGWVIESFFNKADGKHWAKFVITSDAGLQAIKRGYVLSNSYNPEKPFGPAGLCNGVEYDAEILNGEYDHLALVGNPRYEESIVLTPEKFKGYCESKLLELEKLSNDNGKEGKSMKLSIFKKAKVEKLENGMELEALVVQLPKTKREMTISQLVNEADDTEEKKKDKMANADDSVDVGDKHGGKMTVKNLIEKHQAMYDELERFKAQNVDMGGEEAAEEGGDVDHMENADDDGDDDGDKMANGEGDVEPAKKSADVTGATEKKKQNAADAKKAAAKVKADKVRNAGPSHKDEEAPVFDSSDRQVARGRSRYGS